MTDFRVADRDRFGWQDPVIDKDLAAPPGSPSEGARHIVGPSATGAWSGHDDEIAEYVEAVWQFYTPAAGWRVDILDESKEYRYSGATWILVEEGGGADTPRGYIYGLIIRNNATNPNYQIDIQAGQCRNDNNDGDLILTTLKTVDLTASGAGGLDTGSETSSTWYFVWLIYNPTTTTYDGLFSLSSTSPTMPTGYTKKRRIGVVRNNPSGHFYEFIQIGNGSSRRTKFMDALASSVLWGGTAIDYTDIDCSALIPETSHYAAFIFWGIHAGQNIGIWVRKKGSTVTVTNGLAAYDEGVLYGECATDDNQEIQYLVSSGASAYIMVASFFEDL